MSSLDTLYDTVLDARATVKMQSKRAPRVAIEYELDAGIHSIAVTWDGMDVAHATAHDLDRAARRCLRDFDRWFSDSEAGLGEALAVSVDVAKAGGFR